MQQGRSCLIVLLGIVLLVLLVFFGGRAYVHWHMAQVNRDLFAVAEQLGYTPDALLQHRVKMRDINLFFPWDSYCDTRLSYTTPLSPAEFGERVVQVLPEIKGRWSQPMFTSSLPAPGLHINGVDVEAMLLLPVSEEEKLISYHWFASDNSNDIYLELYETANLRASLDFKGLPITGNIVEIYKNGGDFPIWMGCPVKTTEIESPTD